MHLSFSQNGTWRTIYQRQKSAASQVATPEQLRQSHSAAASAGANSAELEGSIGEGLTAKSSRDQASSYRDKGVQDESKSV